MCQYHREMRHEVIYSRLSLYDVTNSVLNRSFEFSLCIRTCRILQNQAMFESIDTAELMLLFGNLYATRCQGTG